MGVSCADFNGDGRPDLYLTHFINAKNTLYRNQGKLLFFDDSYHTNVAAISRNVLGFGSIAFDYDGDGAVDLFVANGHVLGPNISPHEMNPQLLRNDGLGRFKDISEQAGEYFAEKWLGRGASGADFDNDGDLDIAVTHLHQPFALLLNDTKVDRTWVGLDLKSSNRIPPTGGRIVLIQSGRRQVRPIIAGGSYLCSHDPRHQFWVEDGNFELEVHWPSGTVDRWIDPPRNQYLRLCEGQTAGKNH